MTRLPSGISSTMALASSSSGMRARWTTVFTAAPIATATASGLSQRWREKVPRGTGAAATANAHTKVGNRSKMNHVAMKTSGMTQ
jgi:hypothetical protein